MKDVIENLNDLLMLDFDAVRAYTTAIDRITIPLVKERLAEFRGDHQRHITDLTALVKKLGGEAKEHQDLRGPFIQGMTAIRSMMGNEEALKAMKSNEELTNRRYADALQKAFPADVQELVRRNYQDEVRHLASINQAIEDRIFEQADTGANP